jgi:hypothetical protein
MRFFLLMSAMVALSSCSDPAVRLTNPRTGMVATCDANRLADMSPHANEHCAQEYEQQGYIRGSSGWPPR